jgi:hypothetical protein
LSGSLIRRREGLPSIGKPHSSTTLVISGPLNHFGYFRPTQGNLYDKLLAKDKRSANEFEYLNAAGAWGQLILAGLEEICDQDFYLQR